MSLYKDFFDALNTPSEPRATPGKKDFVKKDISGQQVAIVKRGEIIENKSEKGGKRVSFQLYFPAFNQTEFDNVQLTAAAAGVLRGKLELINPNARYSSEADIKAVLDQAAGGKLQVGVKKNGEYWNFYWNFFTPVVEEVEDEDIIDDDLPF